MDLNLGYFEQMEGQHGRIMHPNSFHSSIWKLQVLDLTNCCATSDHDFR